MKKDSRNLEELARRVAAGNAAAAAEFLMELQPPLARIVRGVLRGRCPSSPLAPRIRSEAERISAGCPDAANREEIAVQVAKAVSASLIEQLRARPEACPAICDTIMG